MFVSLRCSVRPEIMLNLSFLQLMVTTDSLGVVRALPLKTNLEWIVLCELATTPLSQSGKSLWMFGLEDQDLFVVECPPGALSYPDVTRPPVISTVDMSFPLANPTLPFTVQEAGFVCAVRRHLFTFASPSSYRIQHHSSTVQARMPGLPTS